MLREWGMDVIAFGPSAHEPDAYFLIRTYDDLADLNAQEDAFYGSPLWRDGPRESIVSRIESYLSTVLWLSPESIEDLRRSNVYAAEGVNNVRPNHSLNRTARRRRLRAVRSRSVSFVR